MRKKKGSHIKRCIIVINKLSGNGNRADERTLKTALGAGYAVDYYYIVEKQKLEDFSEYDRIVVCGGDGTLNGILNSKIRDDVEIIICRTARSTSSITAESKTIISSKTFALQTICIFHTLWRQAFSPPSDIA